MNIKRWTKLGTSEVRFYFDMRFGAYRFGDRSLNSALDGSWIGADHNGNACIFSKSPATGRPHSPNRDWADAAFFRTEKPVSFAVWEQAFTLCLTSSGAFSEAKWGKLDVETLLTAEAA